jgi:hypothetical protein
MNKYSAQNLFSDILNLRHSLSVGEEVSRSYKTIGKIIVFLYFNLPVLRKETGRQKNFKRIVASIP